MSRPPLFWLPTCRGLPPAPPPGRPPRWPYAWSDDPRAAGRAAVLAWAGPPEAGPGPGPWVLAIRGHDPAAFARWRWSRQAGRPADWELPWPRGAGDSGWAVLDRFLAEAGPADRLIWYRDPGCPLEPLARALGEILAVTPAGWTPWLALETLGPSAAEYLTARFPRVQLAHPGWEDLPLFARAGAGSGRPVLVWPRLGGRPRPLDLAVRPYLPPAP
ncbi:protein of unknown function [Candidatus Hydrogenisulfobacillus filiaventi]|uniref:Uncharacterized protein n=1 Tax=Candidatus Hydrogenisulfobacillus filiaventi TaxID=2707344 RepID=A0A6F8ZI10_9FIRM|nr:hypothetical protein [Bacillota bacterium]CAB1129627.1 protein of unknown function [Candidatus Hydrogenisulfobacillus filiaventi]